MATLVLVWRDWLHDRTTGADLCAKAVDNYRRVSGAVGDRRRAHIPIPRQRHHDRLPARGQVRVRARERPSDRQAPGTGEVGRDRYRAVRDSDGGRRGLPRQGGGGPRGNRRAGPWDDIRRHKRPAAFPLLQRHRRGASGPAGAVAAAPPASGFRRPPDHSDPLHPSRHVPGGNGQRRGRPTQGRGGERGGRLPGAHRRRREHSVREQRAECGRPREGGTDRRPRSADYPPGAVRRRRSNPAAIGSCHRCHSHRASGSGGYRSGFRATLLRHDDDYNDRACGGHRLFAAHRVPLQGGDGPGLGHARGG